jgi:hypothetical protein
MSRNCLEKDKIQFVYENLNSYENIQRFFRNFLKEVSYLKRRILLDCRRNEFNEIVQHQFELKSEKFVWFCNYSRHTCDKD